jgi:predicted O-methyltransferase YrrM
MSFERRRTVADRILDLTRGDPFEEIIQAAEVHRLSHGPSCGLYPAGPHVMRLVAALVRASRPIRLLDLGTGFGYSALWLASACEGVARIEAIDRFPDHVSRAVEFAKSAGLSDRVDFIVGEVADVLDRVAGRYDLVHDDAWFASEPPYLERVIELLRPGGALTMPNWFLLEDAISGEPRRDWSEFAGPGWRESTIAYAERLARDPRLYVTWSLSPPLAIAVKHA